MRESRIENQIPQLVKFVLIHKYDNWKVIEKSRIFRGENPFQELLVLEKLFQEYPWLGIDSFAGI